MISLSLQDDMMRDVPIKTHRILSAFLIITASILVPILIPTATAETRAEHLTKLLREGNFLYTQNNYDQALETFENVLGFDSNNTFAMDSTGTLNKKGLALVTLGNHTAALDLFDKVLSIYPNSTDAYVNKGAAFHALGKDRDALTSLDKALAIDANDTSALTVKALMLYYARNFTGARMLLDKVLEIEPENFLAFSLRMRIDNTMNE